jgi:MFS family permease
MTIPVYIFAMIVVIVWAMISDHYGVRSTFIVLGFSSAVIGLVALLAIPHPKYPGLTYFFLFLTAAGIYCPQQLIVSWTGTSLSFNLLPTR